MSNTKRFVLFILLPAIGLLLYPPSSILNGFVGVIVAILFIAFLGWMVWRGRSVALTLLILTQGLNVIIRLMMFLPNSVSKDGSWNLPFAITCLAGIVLSFYLMLRLDKPDIRSQLTA